LVSATMLAAQKTDHDSDESILAVATRSSTGHSTLAFCRWMTLRQKLKRSQKCTAEKADRWSATPQPRLLFLMTSRQRMSFILPATMWHNRLRRCRLIFCLRETDK